nr:protein S2 - Phalaris coerulescens [Phalaris coerulescens]
MSNTKRFHVSNSPPSRPRNIPRPSPPPSSVLIHGTPQHHYKKERKPILLPPPPPINQTTRCGGAQRSEQPTTRRGDRPLTPTTTTGDSVALHVNPPSRVKEPLNCPEIRQLIVFVSLPAALGAKIPAPDPRAFRGPFAQCCVLVCRLKFTMGGCVGKDRGIVEDKLDFKGGNVHVITTKEDWDQKIAEANKDGKIVVANFSASWCGPCRVIAPVYAEMSKTYPQLMFLTIDVDDLVDFSSTWDIRATPTFFFLKNGQQIDKLVGANKPELEKKVQALGDGS